MSNTIDFEQQDKEYIANTYGRFNVCFEKGKGSLLWDVNGKEYIDLGSGIGVTAFGVDDDEWTEAVTKQSHALNHISNLYYSLPSTSHNKEPLPFSKQTLNRPYVLAIYSLSCCSKSCVLLIISSKRTA